MSVKKIIFTLVFSFVLSFCFYPVVTLAATTSDSIPEMALTECLTYLVSATEFEVNSTYPICDHRDPTVSHSTLLYLRTVYFSNVIDECTDVRDWYRCALCGYETYWVRMKIYN